MKFLDTTKKDGLVNDCEFWTNLGDGTISSDPVLLSIFTKELNECFNDILPIVLGRTDEIRYDDPQQTTHPIGFADLVIGKSSYTYLTDSLGNSVYNITRVFMRSPNNDTLDWDIELNRVPTGAIGTTEGNQSGVLSGVRTDYSTIVNPRFSETGVPHSFTEINGQLFLYPIPNYNNAEGLKILFERAPVRFISSGVTTIGAIPFANVEAGIPDMFQRLVSMRASRNWIAVFKSDNSNLLNVLDAAITKKESQLDAFQSKKTPTKSKLSAMRTSGR